MKTIETIKLAIQKAAAERKKMAVFHSRLLLCAEEFEDFDARELCRRAGVPADCWREFRKIMALAGVLSEPGCSIQKS